MEGVVTGFAIFDVVHGDWYGGDKFIEVFKDKFKNQGLDELKGVFQDLQDGRFYFYSATEIIPVDPYFFQVKTYYEAPIGLRDEDFIYKLQKLILVVERLERDVEKLKEKEDFLKTLESRVQKLENWKLRKKGV